MTLDKSRKTFTFALRMEPDMRQEAVSTMLRHGLTAFWRDLPGK
jgi:hypothetical protein